MERKKVNFLHTYVQVNIRNKGIRFELDFIWDLLKSEINAKLFSFCLWCDKTFVKAEQDILRS